MSKKKNVDPSQVPLMKSELVAAAFEILMEAYIGSLGRCSSGQKVTITIKCYNCYIKFSGFREYFDICLYKSGDIDIRCASPAMRTIWNVFTNIKRIEHSRRHSLKSSRMDSLCRLWM